MELSKPSVNIGLVGHVDHGKTTIVNALTNTWTDRHSEEIKRGISIRLGYANATFRKCPNCEDGYTVEENCPICGSPTVESRTVSFVDAPGHETLMATMLCGAAIMDGALLVIAADEPCPQLQTEEHLMALSIVGIKNIVIAQNKIDLVSKKEVYENYTQIKSFLTSMGFSPKDIPIIPISAQQKINLEYLIKAIEEHIPTPQRRLDASARLFIARSFDVNRPGQPIEDLVGGVIGGSLSFGVLKSGDEIEIRPGYFLKSGRKGRWIPLRTKICKIMSDKMQLEEATPGGLLGISTMLDPAIVKSDALVGQVAGEVGTLPPVWERFSIETELFDRVIGSKDDHIVENIKIGEPLMLNVGTATTVGIVQKVKKNLLEVELKRPVCAEEGSRIAISKRVSGIWRLIGVGRLKNDENLPI
ncbi:translation initiation factor IF-2 subunit gamma [Candidatus Methanoliparum sp. LAM-1]|uniref:translation initiation factor IF-2 subunit gamma n=1 Tax=Candidatus Methanoliparum sp. LAM-1 TaxID=2874846 RepID=UPI001E6524F4|nr:translation initiation factor IF-2 subunit gamma [Candidatus Methanoliparum sp. LAM-1]